MLFELTDAGRILVVTIIGAALAIIVLTLIDADIQLSRINAKLADMQATEVTQ
jgi:hypothetical protein